MNHSNEDLFSEILQILLDEKFLFSKIKNIEEKILLLTYSQEEEEQQKENLSNSNLSFFITIYNFFAALKFFIPKKQTLFALKENIEKHYKTLQIKMKDEKGKISVQEQKKLENNFILYIEKTEKILNEQTLTIFLIFIKIKGLLEENQEENFQIESIYKENFPDILEQMEELCLIQQEMENMILIMNTLEKIALMIFKISDKEKENLEKEKKLTKNFI